MLILKLGKFEIREDYPNTAHPFCVYKNGQPLQVQHGIYTGYRRFGSAATAKKWVEGRALPSQRAAGWETC
jgi:hypothetical protein